MKTIRHATFETNSSSTHAYTIHTSSGRKPDMTPIIETDEIEIQLHSSEPNGWTSKVGFLLEYAKEINDAAAFKRIIDAVEKFADVKVKAWESVYDKTVKNYIKAVITPKTIDGDVLSDEGIEEMINDGDYSCWNNSDYSDNFAENMRSNISSEENIVAYCFNSAVSYDTHEYYDG